MTHRVQLCCVGACARFHLPSVARQRRALRSASSQCSIVCLLSMLRRDGLAIGALAALQDASGPVF